MKSAYELAMERLAKSDPSAGKPLTAEQKSRLAEIDRVYQGKLAEREIFLKKQLNDALADGKADEYGKIQKQLASERARIEEEREEDGEEDLHLLAPGQVEAGRVLALGDVGGGGHGGRCSFQGCSGTLGQSALSTKWW